MIDEAAELSVPERIAAIERYRGYVTRLDREIGTLVREVKKRSSRSLFVITSDHGEEWFDHGGLFHGFTLHEELLRVPLIIHGSEVEAARRSGPVRNIDVLPTLCTWLGVPTPKVVDGRDVTTALRGDGPFPEEIIAETAYEQTLESIQVGALKLIRNRSTGRSSLFDLQRDPQEWDDVLVDRGVEAEELERRLDAHRSRMARARKSLRAQSSTVGLDPDAKARLIEELKSLGYVGGGVGGKLSWPTGIRMKWRDIYRNARYLPPSSEAFEFSPQPMRAAYVPSRSLLGEERDNRVSALLDCERASVILARTSESGIAEVRVDGSLFETVDLYDPEGNIVQTIISVSFPESGTHRVEVIVTGEKNPAAQAAAVIFDGMVVE